MPIVRQQKAIWTEKTPIVTWPNVPTVSVKCYGPWSPWLGSIVDPKPSGKAAIDHRLDHGKQVSFKRAIAGNMRPSC